MELTPHRKSGVEYEMARCFFFGVESGIPINSVINGRVSYVLQIRRVKV